VTTLASLTMNFEGVFIELRSETTVN